MYYNAEIGQWLSGFSAKQHRRPYKQIPGHAICSETDPLIAQNVHGSKLIKFEVGGQLQGKQWDNFRLKPHNSNHKSDKWNRYSVFNRIILLVFCGGPYFPGFSHISDSENMY
jgi:hypothetical protein